MREERAGRLATLLLGVAVTGATYYVLKTPARRRAVWRLVRTALAAAGPWLVSEARSAWAQSARQADSPAHDAPPGGGI